MYYCSKLIYEILKKVNQGKEVFPLIVMTFKAEDSDEMTKGWIEYFEHHNISIPKGEYGINRGAMSRSKVISIVHYFG